MEFEQCIVFPYEDIEKGSRIVLYGAGDVGQAFYSQIKRKDYCHIVGWLDRRWENTEGLEPPYITRADLQKLNYDKIVIAVSSSSTAENIGKSLIQQGVKEEKIFFSEHTIVRYRGGASLPQRVEKKTTEEKAAERQVGIGILAVSNIAATIARTVQMNVPNAKIVAVGSRTLEKAQRFAERFHIAKAYGSYEEMLADADVEIVYISSPASFHYEHTMLCLQHEKHVLCEKPFAMNAQQAEKMLSYARKKNSFLSDGLWTSYLPMAETIAKIAESGRIGRVCTVCANQHYYAPPETRLRNSSLGGSAVLEMGVYLISFANIVFGTTVQKVCALGEVNEDGIDEQAAMILQYDNGLAVLNCGMNAVSDRMGTIYGDKGYIIIQDANEYKRMQVYGTDGKLIDEINMASGYECEIRTCVQAVIERKLETIERSHEKILSCMRTLDIIKHQIENSDLKA